MTTISRVTTTISRVTSDLCEQLDVDSISINNNNLTMTSEVTVTLGMDSRTVKVDFRTLEDAKDRSKALALGRVIDDLAKALHYARDKRRPLSLRGTLLINNEPVGEVTGTYTEGESSGLKGRFEAIAEELKKP